MLILAPKALNIILQYDTINGNYICYYLDTTERSFADASSNCQNIASGANLASMQTMYEQAFITSYVRDTTAWIGLQKDQVRCNRKTILTTISPLIAMLTAIDFLLELKLLEWKYFYLKFLMTFLHKKTCPNLYIDYVQYI